MTGNTGEQSKPALELYYSYAPQDETLCLELEKHLKPLERDNLVKGWHRGKIPPGTNESQEIENHRDCASVVLLLLSPDYVASDDCYAEMQWALEHKQADGLLVIPIILRPIEAEDIPFKTAQLLPTRGRPVTNWPSHDEAFQDILLGMRRLLEREEQQQRQPAPSLVWNLPYTRNALFTGREHLLQQLHANLSGNKAAILTQPQAISGLGGIGKTQTAVEYAYRHRDEYRYILWVNADTRDTIITSFLALATLLKLPERQEQDQNLMIAAIKHWFTAHDGWLLIFDNADDLSLVEEFLPPGGKGHLLLTTRAHAPGTLANGLAVEQMNTNEAMLLLLRRARVLQPDDAIEQTSAADRAAAEAIAREMDGLPLALDQAGAYIEETQCSLTSYLNQYRDRKRQNTLLHRRGGTGKQHPEPVAATWSLSFEQVEKLNPVAADLLRFLAFLAPDAIPEQLVMRGASQLSPTLQPLADDESLLDEAIAALARYSLLRRKRDDSILTVHRLVQTVLKHTMDEQTQRQWAEYAVRAVNKAFPDVTDYRNWPRCQQFLPHAQTCAVLIDHWQFAFSEAGTLCNRVGYYLDDRAQYAEAQTFYQRAIAIGEQTLGPEHPNLATWLNNLALLYKTQGKYEEAEPLYQRAIAIDEQALGPEHPELATDLNNLAELYREQGKYEEAEPLYRRAITIGEQTLGSEHPTLAIWLNNLALLYKTQGKYEEAEPLYRRAIAIGEKTLGPEHPNLATWLNNLANLFLNQGKYEETESLYRRSITIGEQTLGPEHPRLAVWLNNLANLYLNQGKYEEAEPLYRRAIAINEKVFGPTHHNTIIFRKNYEGLLRQWKKGKGG
jgi:tetratricopeptide (TPR) repeat protein